MKECPIETEGQAARCPLPAFVRGLPVVRKESNGPLVHSDADCSVLRGRLLLIVLSYFVDCVAANIKIITRLFSFFFTFFKIILKPDWDKKLNKQVCSQILSFRGAYYYTGPPVIVRLRLFPELIFWFCFFFLQMFLRSLTAWVRLHMHH